MNTLLEIYRKDMLNDSDGYIECCELYDLSLSSKESYEVYVFDRLFKEYTSDRNGDKKDLFKEHEKEILEYIQNGIYKWSSGL